MRYLFLIIGLFALGCGDDKRNAPAPLKPLAERAVAQENTVTDLPVPDSVPYRVLILPISNGYDFATVGYDFVPALSHALTKQKGISMLPFPYKRLMGTAYQGVYDKKYCTAILEKVETDFIVMSRYILPGSPDGNSYPNQWGYEIKILETTTMRQRQSIGKKQLKDHAAIEKDILENLGQLMEDMIRLR